MSPIREHYQGLHLIGAKKNENPTEIVRELPKLQEQGRLELIVDNQTSEVFEKPEGDVKEGYSQKSLDLIEAASIYGLNGQMHTIKTHEKEIKIPEEVVNQKLTELNSQDTEEISKYCITKYLENGDAHYYLDIKMPFDFNKEDVKFFVNLAKDEFKDLKEIRVARVYQEDGEWKFDEEYSHGHVHEEVEALGLKKGDFLHIRATVPSNNKFESEEALMFLELLAHHYTLRFNQNKP